MGGLFLRKSFTLIELLVVATIITILFGMLAPAVAKSKNVAQSSQCQGNLKQFGLATASYLNDFNYYPRAWVNASCRWTDMIKPHLNNNQLFACPNEQQPSPYQYDTSIKVLSYGINCTNFSANNTYYFWYHVKAPSIKTSSKVILFADTENQIVAGLNRRYYFGSGAISPVPYLMRRHNAQFNAVYCDGHVDSLGEDTRYNTAYWDASL